MGWVGIGIVVIDGESEEELTFSGSRISDSGSCIVKIHAENSTDRKNLVADVIDALEKSTLLSFGNPTKSYRTREMFFECNINLNQVLIC